MSIKNYLKLKDPEYVSEKIASFVREYVEKRNANGVIFGLSGGVDSALVTFLLRKALPREKILALFMGEREYTPKRLKHGSSGQTKLKSNLRGLKFKET